MVLTSKSGLAHLFHILVPVRSLQGRDLAQCIGPQWIDAVRYALAKPQPG